MEMKILLGTRVFWTTKNYAKVLMQLNCFLWQFLNVISCFLLETKLYCKIIYDLLSSMMPILFLYFRPAEKEFYLIVYYLIVMVPIGLYFPLDFLY